MTIAITRLCYQENYRNEQPEQDNFTNAFFPRIITDHETNSITVSVRIPAIIEKTNDNSDYRKKIVYSEKPSNGEEIDITKYNQSYLIKNHETITVISSVKKPFENKVAFTQSIKSLVHNDAVSKIMETIRSIEEFNAIEQNNVTIQDKLGVGRYLVRPTLVREFITIPDTDVIDINDKLLNVFGKMLSDTYFYEAINLLKEQGIESDYYINIGTSQKIADKIRNLFNETWLFNTKFFINLVTSDHPEMADKIVITFRLINKNDPNVVIPLNFGNNAWKPVPIIHATLSTPDGNHTTEVIHPCYLLLVNCPIVGLLTLK